MAKKIVFTRLVITIIFGLLQLIDYLCSQKQKNMATRKQIESIKIDENVFPDFGDASPYSHVRQLANSGNFEYARQ